MKIEPGPRRGSVEVPPSKSHEHRLLIANFLAGERDMLSPAEGDNADIAATRRCLRALAAGDDEPVLDCGESGSTLRFLAPLAAALGRRPKFVRSGRLGERPFREYTSLKAGVHELPGGVSSQFATGLLFALPLMEGDSRIVFTSPLESRGYVDMTLDVIRRAGVEIEERGDGFSVRGGQRYSPQESAVERDWSGAAFWCAMNALGSEVDFGAMPHSSLQPDRAVARLARDLPREIDVSQFPDIFPALAVVAAGAARRTRFTGIGRLRIKECDRAAAMADVLGRFGITVAETETDFTVDGTGGAFAGGGAFTARGDHRIAMAVAAGATRAEGAVELDDPGCAKKSYPRFFAQFLKLERKM
jgi:3-phosphoshikimate 1-carboxyvinyltransferase